MHQGVVHGPMPDSWYTYHLLPTLNKTIPGHASRRTPTLRHP